MCNLVGRSQGHLLWHQGQEQEYKVFGDIEASENKNLFIPKPTPLCHWCNFCTTNPEATIYKNECEYYSKWTPTQKTFEVNKKWNALENNNTEKKRKLVF